MGSMVDQMVDQNAIMRSKKPKCMRWLLAITESHIAKRPEQVSVP